MRKFIILIAIASSTLIGPAVYAAPMSDADMPERIPFTNKPVTPGNPESYIGTYGQCPFYENAMEKGCFPPSDIECNADWSYCQPRTASVSQPAVENASTPAPTVATSETVPKSTNSGYVGGGSSSSYATTDANEPTNVNETTETVDVANEDVNAIAGIPAENVDQVKNDTRPDMSVEILIGGIAIVLVAFGAWYWWKKPFRK